MMPMLSGRSSLDCNILDVREKDLELAAKIGKTLLDKNRDLQQTNEMLEQELTLATDKVTQLKHDLQQKVNLLHSVTDAESDFYYSSNK
ncbi:unnamed protein product [Soboliphyme baturini]|uniref:HAP1 N-terminal domain-containing protein n=1 Tax=Soboliphyme baturini TaxID=241478 RepID=A0A183IE90_9BILA|nr:unnamed protein product [Soboliphyme baturini]